MFVKYLKIFKFIYMDADELDTNLSHYRVCKPVDIKNKYPELYIFLKDNNINIVNPKVNVYDYQFIENNYNNDYVFYNDKHYIEISGILDNIIPLLKDEFGIK